MKKIKMIIITLLLLCAGGLIGQPSIKPDFYFNEHPGTHNMGITSDGNYYYTCNGGKAYEGKISKYSLNGNLIESYGIELDMRSIMYNFSDKHFYINCYDQNIYRITDLKNGSFQLVFSNLYSNPQASLGMDVKGRYFYYFDDGTLSIYNVSDGKLKNRIYGLQCGADLGSGSHSVAVTKKNVITLDAEKQLLYVYDQKGKLKETIPFSKGDYAYSLSYANGYIFLATDGNYSNGIWYGYAY
jgi:hypothetical protein